MYQEALRPAWVEISLSNLTHNIRRIIEKVGSADRIIGVIKADAYGHGAIRTAETLRQNGILRFAVANLTEAIELRNAGFADEQIIVLGLIPSSYADFAAAYDLTVVLCSSENALAFSEAAQKRACTVKALIAVDTGMGRIGYLAEDAASAAADIRKILSFPSLEILGLFSHLSTADAADKTFCRHQEAQFLAFDRTLRENGLNLPIRTLANSASITELPELIFDFVRPGIILYGCYPSAEVDHAKIDLRPVMSVKADIVHLKDVPSGFSISYGRAFTTTRPSRIATIGIGYADGLPRAYSKKARALVNGMSVPIAGNICMDQCMIDVTDVPSCKIGDEVILMGSDGQNQITAEEIAEATGTINYEVLCAFGQRLPKIYLP